MKMLFGLALAAALLTGCGTDCGELQDICELCPNTPEGAVARSSCEGTVQADDADACLARIEDDTYGPSGCR